MSRKILPPTVFFVFIGITVVVHLIFSIWKIIPRPYHYFGFFLMLLGTTLNLWADRIYKIEKTAISPYDRPSRLIESGPFRVSRNPMYLGMFMMVLGLAVFLRTGITLVVPLLFAVILDRVYIRHEESVMEKEFPAGFRNYRSRVRRWL
jgi:protein-S-isoprenylcysteine O-methyltransferase Ste14